MYLAIYIDLCTERLLRHASAKDARQEENPESGIRDEEKQPAAIRRFPCGPSESRFAL